MDCTGAYGRWWVTGGGGHTGGGGLRVAQSCVRQQCCGPPRGGSEGIAAPLPSPPPPSRPPPCPGRAAPVLPPGDVRRLQQPQLDQHLPVQQAVGGDVRQQCARGRRARQHAVAGDRLQHAAEHLHACATCGGFSGEGNDLGGKRGGRRGLKRGSRGRRKERRTSRRAARGRSAPSPARSLPALPPHPRPPGGGRCAARRTEPGWRR